MESQKLTKHKIVYFISFIEHFLINICNKFEETYIFFIVKKAYYVKRQFLSKNFKQGFLWSWYGTGALTGTVTCQKSEPQPYKIVTVPQHWSC